MTTAQAATVRVLRIQKFNRMLGAVLVPLAVWFSLATMMTVGGPLWWGTFILICLIALHLFNTISFAATVFVVAIASGPIEEPDDRLRPVKIELSIENHPETPIGRYKDVEFFEWLDLMDEDKTVRRATFFGTIDLTQETISLPQNMFLLAPGLLYEWAQVDPQ